MSRITTKIKKYCFILFKRIQAYNNILSGIYLNRFAIDENRIATIAAAPRIYVKIRPVPTIFRVPGTL
jgi:hypothetical protein